MSEKTRKAYEKRIAARVEFTRKQNMIPEGYVGMSHHGKGFHGCVPKSEYKKYLKKGYVLNEYEEYENPEDNPIKKNTNPYEIYDRNSWNWNKDCLTPALLRRITFLMDEAKLNGERDQVITFAMRVISNYATIGQDASSTKVKSDNKRVSKSAYELLLKLNSLEEWAKQTINEHQIPLKVLWNEINSRPMTDAEIWSLFLDAPMITITKEEDTKLNKLGLRSSSDRDRYKKAGIDIIVLEDSPSWTIKLNNV